MSEPNIKSLSGETSGPYPHCEGCFYDYGNQLGHMGPGGCLQEPSEFSSSEEFEGSFTADETRQENDTNDTQTIQIVSDVHLEHRAYGDYFTIKPVAKNLALLGDIGKPFHASYRDFLALQSSAFQKVFVIIGNHEKYGSNADAVDDKVRQVCSTFPNVHLLERDSFQLTERTTLLGCTLWSNIDNRSSLSINDFNLIKTNEDKGMLSRDTYLSWHRRDVKWIENAIQTVASEGRKAVVFTHHGPHPAMSGKYLGSPISSAFVTDLSRLLKPPVIAWASGHVHSNVDFVEAGVRLVSNAVGYPRENGQVGFNNDVVLEFD